VTGGVLIGLLGTWQGIGHSVRPFWYWLIAISGLVIAFYRAWAEEHDALLETRLQLSKEDLQKAQIEAIRNRQRRKMLIPQRW